MRHRLGTVDPSGGSGTVNAGGAPAHVPPGNSTAFVRPHALCVSKRQLEQTEFHNRHVGEFVS